MDPMQALRDAETALKNGDFDVMAECLGNYFFWRMRGGFEPSFDAEGERRGDIRAQKLWLELVEGLAAKLPR